MHITTHINGAVVEITTDHAASSYGLPVVLIDGELTAAPVEYTPDTCACNVLDLLADRAGIHNGPRTRRELHRLAREMYPARTPPSGAWFDRVLREFQRRGRKKRASDEDADLRAELREAMHNAGHDQQATGRDQTAAAEEIGISPCTLSRILNAHQSPGRDTIAKLNAYIHTHTEGKTNDA